MGRELELEDVTDLTDPDAVYEFNDMNLFTYSHPNKHLFGIQFCGDNIKSPSFAYNIKEIPQLIANLQELYECFS